MNPNNLNLPSLIGPKFLKNEARLGPDRRFSLRERAVLVRVCTVFELELSRRKIANLII